MADEKEEERKKERKKEEGQNGDFCSGISRLHERLGELRGQLRNTQSEADLSELLWLDLASQFARALLYPIYVQAAILNLLNPYIRSCYRTP